MTTDGPCLVGRGLHKSFARKGEKIRALDGISLEVSHGTLTALVGPDGAGKTTLIRLATGLIAPDEGEIHLFGIDVTAHPQKVQDRIGYMPQRFGLYEDLTVAENLDLYAELHGIEDEIREQQYRRLMQMTALGPFKDRLAGRLSGGMKQKLGLACTLLHSPDLLVLDEPTVGVDPLSRRELWEIILHLAGDQGLTVLLSTSYLDEAERCTRVVVMHAGIALAQGAPAEVAALAANRVFVATAPPGRSARGIQARLLDDAAIIDALPEAGRVRFVRRDRPIEDDGIEPSTESALGTATVVPVSPRFEDGFMSLLRGSTNHHAVAMLLGHQPIAKGGTSEIVVEVHDLLRRFGKFTAVDHISFEVRRGEIFGLLGPNGAGKTTTFRMLCGLIPATGGTLRISGIDLRHARASARQQIGYVAQKFSLYSQLSVAENLAFFAGAYGLRGREKRDRIEWALQQFDLAPLATLPSGQLPGGFKQRLAMAAALLHEPETLFLDEPTSGADPLARREFWRRITALAEQGVSVVITTHFMEEAEYCDHVVIMDAGRLLARGTPAEIRDHAQPSGPREPTMEDAFIAIVEAARNEELAAAAGGAA